MTGAESYAQLMTNAAHWEWELTACAVQDVIVGLLIWPRLKGWLKREHIAQDEEHGVEHHD